MKVCWCCLPKNIKIIPCLSKLQLFWDTVYSDLDLCLSDPDLHLLGSPPVNLHWYQFIRLQNTVFTSLVTDEWMAATVWAARHDSNMHHFTISFLAAWKQNHTSAPVPGDSDWKRHTWTRLQETSEVCRWPEMASDWNVESNQQSFTDQATDQWRHCF